MSVVWELLVEEVKARRIFKRNKKDIKLKILAAILYYLGISLRKTSSFMTIFQRMSHEAVRTYYRRLKTAIQPPQKKKRRLIAIDETKLKIEELQVFVWVAVDVDTREVLTVQLSRGRSSLDAYLFLRRVLKYCENKPEFVVDKGPWCPWAFQRLGLKFKQERFGERSVVESVFSVLKRRTGRFWNRFPYKSSFTSVQSWLESFFAVYNFLEVMPSLS